MPLHWLAFSDGYIDSPNTLQEALGGNLKFHQCEQIDEGSKFQASQVVYVSREGCMDVLARGARGVRKQSGNGKSVCFTLAFKMDTDGKPMYTCGKCGADTAISTNRGSRDPVRCSQCGHRVLYKKRPERLVQFDAR